MTPRRVSREYGILDAARTLIRSPQTLMSAASQTRAQSGRRTQPTSGGWVAIIVFAFLAWLGASEPARLGQTVANKDDAARDGDVSQESSTVRHATA